ncbi:MAG: hypothetical protein IJX80_09615 [Clostridia bacterium]|nr:hypothetical protein [Clostridia bacterium]
MKEIGGYLELEQFVGKPYYSDLIAVNNARCALLYLLRARSIKKLYIPYFLCHSVSGICDREGYAYEYYHVGADFLPIFDKTLGTDEYLYVVNYYGQVSDEALLRLKDRHGRIIFDNVQAFFRRPLRGIDTVYSCRKFFGVPDGGYLSTDVRLFDTLPQDESRDRMKHILGRFEGSASDYYADFRANDRSFVALELREMSRLTQNLLGAIDYEAVRQKRNENYTTLERLLGSYNRLPLTSPDGAYAYPFYCENGATVRKKLAAEKIFVATLWPELPDATGETERDYAENILPLPCDQRYGVEDMNRMVAEVMKCLS